jgi:hypothetical protein
VTGPEVRHLLRVLASLEAHLDEQLEGQLDGLLDGLTADTAVAEARAALARVADPEYGARLADELHPSEAAWLAAEIVRRWAVLASPVLDAQVTVVARDGDPVPGDGGPGQVRLVVEVVGLDPGWTVAWIGAEPVPDEPAAAIWAGPPSGGVTARVLGRGPEGRVVVAAGWRPPTAAGTGG